MSTTKYSILYWDATGRAETSRLMFNLAGVAFEDVRIKFEEWPALKAKQPFLTMPVLTIDGTKKLCQSRAIEVYLAKEFGFYPTDRWEAAQVDQFIQALDDYLIQFKPIYYEQDPVAKGKLIQHFIDVPAPEMLTIFNRFLEQNGARHLVGDKLTLADLALFHCLDIFTNKLHVKYDNYPAIDKFYNAINALPKIRHYLDNRKVTEF
uniref:Glutathione transferase n=1 Tax=Rhabditophanes sp. KR3021 TaxID=114890 RepID=A0AC35UF28_9BILA